MLSKLTTWMSELSTRDFCVDDISDASPDYYDGYEDGQTVLARNLLTFIEGLEKESYARNETAEP